jgi:regulator of protease activity HflC (stomatin/prohibitin superfamily)
MAYREMEEGDGKVRFVDRAPPIGESVVGLDAYNVIPLTTTYQIDGFDDLEYARKHSGMHKFVKFFFLLAFPVISWLYAWAKTRLIPRGSIGITINNGTPEFLPPGWHFLGSIFRSWVDVVPINSGKPIVNLTKGIVTIRDGTLGYAQDRGNWVLLGPGLHQWESDTFLFKDTFAIASKDVVQIGPFTLVTVPPGDVAITENNGSLVTLDKHDNGGRYHFLTHSKWLFRGTLSIQAQNDYISASELLTADRVEVHLESTVSWKIINPHAAALTGGHTMRQIQEIVHRGARATLSNMIACRNISDKAVGRMAVHPVADDPPLEYKGGAETNQQASESQLHECNLSLNRIGVEVSYIAIVQMKIVHEDTRREIAKIAAIPAKTKEMTAIAQAAADNEVTAATGKARASTALAVAEAENAFITAQGQARATIERAKAQAQAMAMLAEAQKMAGEHLGPVNSTAATLAQIEATGKALSLGKNTVFFVPPGGTQGLMMNSNVVKLE